MRQAPGSPGWKRPLVISFALAVGLGSLGRPESVAQTSKPSQALQHEVRVVNIEVPVRVFDGDRFVENLTLEDFEVTENGVPQKLLAVYLVRNAALERKEEVTPFVLPKMGRNFFLFFQVYTHDPKTDDAIAYFVRNVLKPEDGLTVVTSVRPYRLKRDQLQESTKEKLSQQLADLVRRDTLIGNTEYRSILEELRRMTAEGGTDTTGARQPDLTLFGEGGWQEFLMNYRDLRERLEKIRSFDIDRLLSFADYLKTTEGQKIVLMFYQREYMPMVDRKRYVGQFEDPTDLVVEQGFHDLFDVYKRDVKVDAELIKRVFSDASISIHFLFITRTPEHVGGVSDAAMEEHSEDIFSPFLEMAKATGGLAESSSNPASLMQKSAVASENYYLLYYRPSDPTADGKFRNIKVAVKGKGFRILHRAGYLAK